MSGLNDLSGLTLRAYSPPTVKRSEPAPEQIVARDERSKNVDRRLAPAFSIELSLAAQKLLGEPGQVAQNTPAQEVPVTNKPVSQFNQALEGVGRREGPLVNEPTRDIAIGSRLDIQA